MTRFDRTVRALGVLVLVGTAAAVTACHDQHASSESVPAAAAESAPASAPASASAADGAAAATAPAAAPTAAPAGSEAGGLEWKDMKREEREHFMKSVVLPHMKPEFAKWDPGEFGDIKCGTCHGAGARDKTFKMPNPKLPRLPAPDDEAGWKKLQAKEPEALKFMHEVVVPQMAQMLGEKPYDPATKQGFGCFECHTPKK